METMQGKVVQKTSGHWNMTASDNREPDWCVQMPTVTDYTETPGIWYLQSDPYFEIIALIVNQTSTGSVI